MSSLLPASRRAAWILATLVACGSACLLIGTSADLPLVWDEGDALLRAEQIEAWLHKITTHEQRKQANPWTAAEIAAHWPYTIQREGHPTLGAVDRRRSVDCSGPWAPARSALRPFSTPPSGVGLSVVARTLTWAGLTACPCWRYVVSHAHFALGDGPLTSCWILAWACYRPTAMRWYHGLGMGLAVGMAFSCKATAWLLPLPFLIFSLVYADRQTWKQLVFAGGVALLVFGLLNPPLWHMPLAGTMTFFELNLNRAARPEHNISTLFLGRMYNLDYPLPWYNTLIWMLIALPTGTLMLMVGGIATSCRWGQRVGQLLLANALVLLIVRALPGVPPHDGIRLMLPAFAFLAALAGLGAHFFTRYCVDHPPRAPWQYVIGFAFPTLLLAGSASSVVWYWPTGLSHYNLLIGGLRGATWSGMESTYYWDALDNRVLAWLDQNSGADDKVRFGSMPRENLVWLQQWHQLPRDFSIDAPGNFRWYVLQRRPSGYSAVDRWLIEHCGPAYRHQRHPVRFIWNPWQLDVPLIEIYDESDYQRALAATADTPSPIP